MVWVWLALLLGVCVEATSNGVGLTCNVDNSNLGSTARTTKNPNRTMWWVMPPAFAGDQYTLRTADPSTGADPTSYIPGQWMNIFVRTTYQDQQYTGIIMYATNANNQQVGDWEVAANSPFHVMPGSPCVVHSNADPKNYLNVFKFLGPPVGTGPVTIKALVKFGLAFPNPTGTFFWPNNAHITLTERAPTVTQAWFQGEVGESCITVCLKQGLGCDLATMRAQGNSSGILDIVSKFSNCTPPIMPGCSSASPSVGLAGCFYHSDACVQPAPEPMWTRNDPCGNLTTYTSGKQYCCPGQGGPKCVQYQGAEWCCAYSTNSPPVYDAGYGAWGVGQGAGKKATCMPAGGYPAGQGSVPVPVRVNLGSNAITCEASKTSVDDGSRICACSVGGQRVEIGSASQAALPVAVLFLSFIASF